MVVNRQCMVCVAHYSIQFWTPCCHPHRITITKICQGENETHAVSSQARRNRSGSIIGERERAKHDFSGTVHTVHVRMRGNYVKRLRYIKIPFALC